MKNPREIVLDILLDIEKNNKYSNVSLHTALSSNQFMSKQERSYITRMVEGVIEWRIRLDFIINQVSKTKINKCKPLIRCILRMGVYEIFYMDSIPHEATCNECVKLAAKRGFSGLKGFVNGVLRNICRNMDNISFPEKEPDILKYYSIKYSIPEETVSILRDYYEDDILSDILSAGVNDRGTSIRVNTDKTSVEDFMQKLILAGIDVAKGMYNDTSLIISNYDYIRRVPGFFDGCFAVQDESSCLAVKAAGIKEGNLVIDMCAAPGGKTMYAAELAGNKGLVISRDVSSDKTELIEENVERLGYNNVRVEVYDACVLDDSLINKADVVICDLPCSGLGIMGRKNDIKYNISREKISQLSMLQRQMLENGARYVKFGGVLVYSTCTITKEENDDNVKWFIDNFDFELDSVSPYFPNSLEDRASKGYITLLQGIDKCDGFFIARFIKR